MKKSYVIDSRDTILRIALNLYKDRTPESDSIHNIIASYGGKVILDERAHEHIEFSSEKEAMMFLLRWA